MVKTVVVGSPTCNLTIHGVQGHVAIRISPITRHRAAPMLTEPGASSGIKAMNTSPNASMADSQRDGRVPGATTRSRAICIVQFNFRFSTGADRTRRSKPASSPCWINTQLRYTATGVVALGQPFLTSRASWSDAESCNAIEHYNEIKLSC